MEREDPRTCVFPPRKDGLAVRRVVGKSVAGLFVQQAATISRVRSLQNPRYRARSRERGFYGLRAV